MSKTKKQLRAEAVERLTELGGIDFYYEIIDALCGADCDDWTSDGVASAIIDLLTDDDSTITEDDSTTESLSEEADNREKLEADISWEVGHYFAWQEKREQFANKIIGWLDRQAAITKSESRGKVRTLRRQNKKYRKQIERLTADLNTAVCDNNSLRYELESIEEHKTKVWCDCDCCKWQEEREKLTAERDNWKANCEDWKKHARAAENVCYKTMLERDEYREKLSKALDLAHEIGRLQP